MSHMMTCVVATHEAIKYIVAESTNVLRTNQ